MPRSLVEAADAAMYVSKRARRNRVVLRSAPQWAVETPNGTATSKLATIADTRAE
jgi:hypothetical protein